MQNGHLRGKRPQIDQQHQNGAHRPGLWNEDQDAAEFLDQTDQNTEPLAKAERVELLAPLPQDPLLPTTPRSPTIDHALRLWRHGISIPSILPVLT